MRIALVAATLVLIAVAGAACSGDSDTLTLEEYLTELNRISNDIDERSEEVDVPDLALDAPLDERKESAEEAFTELGEIFDEGLSDIRDLEPPEEAEDAHERLVDALDDAYTAIDGYASEIADADSLEELIGAAEDTSGIDSAGETFSEACQELQDLADDNDIDIDLECED